MGTKPINLSRGYEVQPTAAGGIVVYQYSRNGSRALVAAFTDHTDLLAALAHNYRIAREVLQS